MSSKDLAFAGSMPALYDRYLGAMLFPDRVRAFAEMRRVLKPGAAFVRAARMPWNGRSQK